MIKILLTLCGVVLTSFYFFPFEWKAFPGINTKMAMAFVGLCLYLIQLGRSRSGAFNKDTVFLSLWAAIVSCIGFFSITYNNTPDYAYATYLVSMWVWIGAAYLLVHWFRWVHGYASVRLVAHYLIIVCVTQCILALWIDFSPAVKSVVDAYVEQGQNFLNASNVNRLYGIGASLDVAGSRFAAMLAMLAFLMTLSERSSQNKLIPFYWIAFFILAIIGNMVARTTTVGLIVAFLYLLYKTRIYTFHFAENKNIWGWFVCFLLVAIPVLAFMYGQHAEFQKNMRFGFEGFFSLVEEGRWEVSSNERLKMMYVFPETLKTWIIGDGYFANPIDTDPYFTGEVIGGYYMGTDVGYLRFIYFFGLIGLTAFSMFMYKSYRVCCSRLTNYKELFFLFLAINFIVWLKVSTDIFLVFALFLMIDKEENEKADKRILIS